MIRRGVGDCCRQLEESDRNLTSDSRWTRRKWQSNTMNRAVTPYRTWSHWETCWRGPVREFEEWQRNNDRQQSWMILSDGVLLTLRTFRFYECYLCFGCGPWTNGWGEWRMFRSVQYKMSRNVTHVICHWISWLSRDMYANVWEKRLMFSDAKLALSK